MLTMILETLRGLAGGNGLADRYTYGDVYGLWYRLNESVLGGGKEWEGMSISRAETRTDGKDGVVLRDTAQGKIGAGCALEHNVRCRSLAGFEVGRCRGCFGLSEQQ